MAITVPFRPQTIGQQRGGASSTEPPPPPNEVYTLMAAAQMHSEGRLIKPPTGGVEDKLNSISEADAAPVRR